MPRLARICRRPVVIFAVLYLAGVGVLAATVPPRPFAEFRVRLDEERYYELVGLSPDGNTVPTRQSDRGPGPAIVNRTEPDTIWLWDVDATDSRPAAPAVALETPFPWYLKNWFD